MLCPRAAKRGGCRVSLGSGLICFIILQFSSLDLELVVLIHHYDRFNARVVIKIGMSCLFMFVFPHLCVCVLLLCALRIKESRPLQISRNLF